MKVAVIDTFAGGGGFSTGALQAGAIVPYAIEMWDDANLVHHLNHPDTKIIKRELGKYPDVDLQILTSWVRSLQSQGFHVHLHGSPPCQALSNASRADAKDGMFMVRHYIWLARGSGCDSWSMENVVPVAKHLDDDVPWVKLNAADFGVPQTRRRIFAGEGWTAHPTHSKDQWVSVLDALPHLEGELSGFHPVGVPPVGQLNLAMDAGRSSAPTSGVNPKTGKKEGGSGPLYRELDQPSYTIMSGPRKIVSINTSGAGVSVSKRARSVDSDVEGQCKTIHNNPPSLREIKLEALGSNSKRHQDRPVNEPSKTICGSGNQVGPRLFDHTEKAVKIRSLTLEETATLQGFPKDYQWDADILKKSKWVIIGNAVCPPVAEAVIRGIHT